MKIELGQMIRKDRGKMYEIIEIKGETAKLQDMVTGKTHYVGLVDIKNALFRSIWQLATIDVRFIPGETYYYINYHRQQSLKYAYSVKNKHYFYDLSYQKIRVFPEEFAKKHITRKPAKCYRVRMSKRTDWSKLYYVSNKSEARKLASQQYSDATIEDVALDTSDDDDYI